MHFAGRDAWRRLTALPFARARCRSKKMFCLDECPFVKIREQLQTSIRIAPAAGIAVEVLGYDPRHDAAAIPVHRDHAGPKDFIQRVFVQVAHSPVRIVDLLEQSGFVERQPLADQVRAHTTKLKHVAHDAGQVGSEVADAIAVSPKHAAVVHIAAVRKSQIVPELMGKRGGPIKSGAGLSAERAKGNNEIVTGRLGESRALRFHAAAVDLQLIVVAKDHIVPPRFKCVVRVLLLEASETAVLPTVFENIEAQRIGGNKVIVRNSIAELDIQRPSLTRKHLNNRVEFSLIGFVRVVGVDHVVDFEIEAPVGRTSAAGGGTVGCTWISAARRIAGSNRSTIHIAELFGTKKEIAFINAAVVAGASPTKGVALRGSVTGGVAVVPRAYDRIALVDAAVIA